MSKGIKEGRVKKGGVNSSPKNPQPAGDPEGQGGAKIDQEKIILELERRLIWAIRFLHARGGGMVADENFNRLGHWTHWFADGIEMAGHYKVDRELLGLTKKECEKVLKAREAKSAVRQAPTQETI